MEPWLGAGWGTEGLLSAVKGCFKERFLLSQRGVVSAVTLIMNWRIRLPLSRMSLVPLYFMVTGI
jgi:hypothetical protein